MKQNITLRIDYEVYKKYRKKCKAEGKFVSGQVELFMRGKKNGR